MRKTTATQLVAKTSCSIWGRMEKSSAHWVKPRPMDSDSAAMRMLRWVKPARAIIWKPLTQMLPNIMMVQPPSTASGSEEKIALTNGTKPARIMTTAPDAMARRLTTFVMATRPTFCENEVMGMQPKQADSVETKPSQAMEPESSSSRTSRLRPVAASAVVSPMVSVAETRKMRVTARMAPGLNSGAKGMMVGTAMGAAFAKPERSTTPITRAAA